MWFIGLRIVAARASARPAAALSGNFLVAFPTASSAVAAAAQVTRALADHPWPAPASVRGRMGLHTSTPQLVGDHYVVLDVHRAERIAAVGHRGQILREVWGRNLQRLICGMSRYPFNCARRDGRERGEWTRAERATESGPMSTSSQPLLFADLLRRNRQATEPRKFVNRRCCRRTSTFLWRSRCQHSKRLSRSRAWHGNRPGFWSLACRCIDQSRSRSRTCSARLPCWARRLSFRPS
jgi:hypothetical protein